MHGPSGSTCYEQTSIKTTNFAFKSVIELRGRCFLNVNDRGGGVFLYIRQFCPPPPTPRFDPVYANDFLLKFYTNSHEFSGYFVLISFNIFFLFFCETLNRWKNWQLGVWNQLSRTSILIDRTNRYIDIDIDININI